MSDTAPWFFNVVEESAEEMNVEPENDEYEQLFPNYKILEKIEEQQSNE